MKVAKSIAERFKKAKQSDAYLSKKIALDFTEDIIEIMDYEGITKADLARRLDISPPSVNNHLLADGHNLTVNTMVRFSRAVGANLTIRIDHPAIASWDTRIFERKIQYSGDACVYEESIETTYGRVAAMITCDLQTMFLPSNISENKESWDNAIVRA